MFRNILLVGLGGGAGAMLRYGITLLFTAMKWSVNFGTYLTNIIGCFCMGLLASALAQSPAYLMLTVGVLGGFTTYSTFSMQSVKLLQQGDYGAAALYVFGTVLSCVALAAAGWYLGQKLR